MAQDKAAPEAPKTPRGWRTRLKLLDAAVAEFGVLGFHEASVSSITRRAGVALGTFYNYFESKEALYLLLVEDIGRRVRRKLAAKIGAGANRLHAERVGLRAMLQYARDHVDEWRIVREAQFVSEAAFKRYYEVFGEAYQNRLRDAAQSGEIRSGDDEVRSWALMGLAVFLALRYSVWEPDADLDAIADAGADLLIHGLKPEG